MTIQYHAFNTPLGPTLGALSSSGICFLQFGRSPESLVVQLQSQFPMAEVCRISRQAYHLIEPLERIINAAVRGHNDGFETVAIDAQGSEFQRLVWEHLRSIPLGEVRSYSEVARALNMPRSTRAVANACGANSVALLIPCHRVIRTDGSLGGYRWGLEVKRHLLAMERVVCQSNSELTYHGNKVTEDIPETI